MERPSLVAVGREGKRADDERDRKRFEILNFNLKIDDKGMSNPIPPFSTSISFAKGVIARLALWPALRIAVQNGWGGPDSNEKRTWIASVIVDTFEEQSTPPDAEYIEELLLQIMGDEFETMVEDGSAELVARDITKLWQDIHLGDLAGLRHLEHQANDIPNRPVVAHLGLEEVETDSGEEEDDWESDQGDGRDTGNSPAGVHPPEVDEDGFTTVLGKYSKHR